MKAQQRSAYPDENLGIINIHEISEMHNEQPEIPFWNSNNMSDVGIESDDRRWIPPKNNGGNPRDRWIPFVD